MRVDEQRARGTRALELAPDQRVAGGFEQLRREPAPRQHLLQQRRVLADVFAIRGDVGDREQLHELAHDRLLIGAHPRVHLLRAGRAAIAPRASARLVDAMSDARIFMLSNPAREAPRS